MNKYDTTISCWPTAAASRIRVKINGGDDGQYCRLYYNHSSGDIELVPCNENENEVHQQRIVYDDSNSNIEEEPTYQSYLSTSTNSNRNIVDSFHPDDVIGANLSLAYNMKNPNTFHGMSSYASSKLNIYSYPKKKNGKRIANHKHYILDSSCCEDFGDARAIIQAIQQLSKLYNVLPTKDSKNTSKKVLVILNPYSGGGGESSKTGAKHVYNTIVKPMLEEADVEHDALVTQRSGHANERMMARSVDANSKVKEEEEGSIAVDPINTDSALKDISEYNAIIAMGGDGILFEIFQGIHARSDCTQIMSTIKFGILGCGTYNGLVKSILHWSNRTEYNHMESMMHICKGGTFPLDVAKYQVFTKDTNITNNKSYLSFLSYAWGLIADCDFESECLRWLGHLRSDIWAVYRGILFRRQYRARFSYLPPSDDGKEKEVDMPTIGEPLPEGWVTFDDEDFLVFWVCNTSHAAHNMLTCPVAKMNDGLFHVLIVRSSCSKLRVIQLLLKLDSGGHFDCEDLVYIPCVAYQFEPLTNVSYNVLDGELIEDGPIQACMMPGGAQFFANGVE